MTQWQVAMATGNKERAQKLNRIHETSVEVPGGRYWEPGVEENPPLPREKWLDVEPEDLPFK